ncbi:hypothetical protein ADU00_24540, partial [Salmonella enterica subsp. enterica]|nr:hypothetical protein [Salmonella enterica subsp. enterica serovar Hvittingfoss]
MDVSATGSGDGGTAVLWSEEYTGFNGQITATGAGSGKGGRVETSSRGLLTTTGDVKAGQGGEWLLDPADITIVTDTSNSGIFESGKGTSSGGESETAFIL